MRTMIARWIARREFQDTNAEVWLEKVWHTRRGSHQRYRVISCNGSGYFYFHGWRRWFILIDSQHL